jgi:hypothetical protein
MEAPPILKMTAEGAHKALMGQFPYKDKIIFRESSKPDFIAFSYIKHIRDDKSRRFVANVESNRVKKADFDTFVKESSDLNELMKKIDPDTFGNVNYTLRVYTQANADKYEANKAARNPARADKYSGGRCHTRKNRRKRNRRSTRR